ncbi:prolyl 3-hydroxylase 1 [Chanos chanos]|uniref:procollagen-proline 3-dioxygenase n=1 Tax=Chanos chanos TaxID=29144 RepID=A0A6J2VQX2_CHACN|nr:prolyl 3-hydroxylase 1 [Chanos chanos]
MGFSELGSAEARSFKMWISLLLFTFYLCSVQGTNTDTQLSDTSFLEPYDLLFDNAVEAYYKQDWMSVILNMELALRNKRSVHKVRTECRLNCANQTTFGEQIPGLGIPIPGVGSIEDLGFFQRILKRAACVSSCESEKLGPPTLYKISEEMDLEFKKRTPYNYLQVAYFKINKLDKAVAAANTFYIANPDHVEMRQNLEYYKMMAGVQETDFKDLEAKPHMAEFLEGKRLYSSDEFGPAIDHFELAVNEYFAADQECRVLCEGAYDYDGYNYMEYTADLFQAITDHYLYVLNCKQNCAVELASTAGRDKPFEDFLPSHFNYLQFSYYNTEQYEKAIECAKTYLLFHPEDETMNQNLAYYSVVLGEDKAADISAREVVRQHIKKSLLEKELLYFGYEIFGITFVDPDSWTPADVMPLKLREKQKAERETAARITEEIGNLMKEIETLVEEKHKESSDLAKMVKHSPTNGSLLIDDVKVTMTSKELNGTQRVLMDGVISDDECRELHRLSNAAAQKGDGYRGRPSPHSSSEMFQGVTVLKALKLGQEGVVPLKSAHLFFNVSEKIRKVIESYFQLESPLYFSYTHLVCRAAIEDKQEDREDLSHPVHADNCLLISELNECIKEPPAYTHRDYSAILYLNDDFEGGDFIFTELDAKTVTAVVKPQCGRVVGFGAGKENPHGVRAVTKGQRCAVALWFTLDPRHHEKERVQAEDLLKMLSTPVDSEFQTTVEDSGTGGPEGTTSTTEAERDQVLIPTDGPVESQKDKRVEERTDEPVTEQPVKSTDQQPAKAGDKKSGKSKDDNKTKVKDKAKAGSKTQTKTGTQTKAKQSEKTKAKQADKTKVKQADKKEKPAVKKTVKTAAKKATGNESSGSSGSKQPKVKSSKAQDSQTVSSSTVDTQKDKDEL